MARKKQAGPGRPTLSETGENMETGTFRRTEEQAVKLEALGGAKWIRAQIDAAPWPRGAKPRQS